MLVACAGLLTLAAMVVSSSSPASSRTTQSTNTSVLTIAGLVPVADVNPFKPINQISTALYHSVFDELVQYNQSAQIVPDLATSWSASSDHKTYTFQLNPAARFTDGSAVTPADVVFSVKYAIAKSTSFSFNYLTDVKSITAVGTKAVAISFPSAEPEHSLLTALTYDVIVNPSTMSTINKNPDGTGPYTVSSFAPGVQTTLTRKASYWGTETGPATIKLIGAPDPTSAITALEAKTFDGYYLAPWSAIATLKKVPTVNIVLPAVYSNLFLVEGDTRTAPFNNPIAREALSYAINRQEIVNAAFAGVGKVDNSGLPVAIPGVETNMYQYNPAKARALFKKAGVKTVTFGAATSDTYFITLGEILQQNLKAAGVQMKIKTYPTDNIWYATFGPINKVWPGLVEPGEYTPPADALDTLALWEGGICECNYLNKSYNKAVNSGLQATTSSAQTKSEKAALAIFAHDQPVSIIAYSGIPIAVNSYVKNVWIQTDGIPRFESATVGAK